MADVDLTTMLGWLQERTEHQFTVDTGMVTVDSALIRGGEPGFRWDDESRESYGLTVYLPAFGVHLDPDDLKAEIVDDELQLRTRCGHFDIQDDGER